MDRVESICHTGNLQLTQTAMEPAVGIDIAKDSFEAALPQDGRYHTRSFSNDALGFEALSSGLPEGARCVMEASGPYGFRLATYLHGRGHRVAVVNPLVIRRYGQMVLQRTKTDKADALLIADYANKMEPEPWQPPEEAIQELKQCQSVRDQLVKQRTQLRNALDSLRTLPHPSRHAQESLEQVLAELEQQLRRLEQQMDHHVEMHWEATYRLLSSIKGIGRRTIVELIVVTHAFTRFETVGQLVSYIGLCPRIYDSGTSVRGKPRLSKLGLASTRRILYMAAQSAIRYNEDCRALYNRLVARGKRPKVARVAVAHKLLRQAFAVVSSGVPYVAGYESKCRLTLQ